MLSGPLGLQAGAASVVRGGRPGFLNISVHGLWEPLKVLGQQVCREGREGGQSSSVPARQLQGRSSHQPQVPWVAPYHLPPNPLAVGHPPWSGSHLGFLLQATSKASRQLAFLATRALRRLSVLGCSLWVGRRTWGILKFTARPALPRRSPSVHHAGGAGWMEGSRLHHLPPLASGPPTQAASVLAACPI